MSCTHATCRATSRIASLDILLKMCFFESGKLNSRNSGIFHFMACGACGSNKFTLLIYLDICFSVLRKAKSIHEPQRRHEKEKEKFVELMSQSRVHVAACVSVYHTYFHLFCFRIRIIFGNGIGARRSVPQRIF